MAKSGLRHIDVGPELTKTEWESEESHELIHGTSFPESPVERQLFYRDDEHKWYIYNASAWVWLGGGGGGMEVHGNEYHDPDFEQQGVAASLVETHRTTATHTQPQPPAEHGNEKHNPDFATESALSTHASTITGVHGLPSSYSGQARKVITVKSDESGLQCDALEQLFALLFTKSWYHEDWKTLDKWTSYVTGSGVYDWCSPGDLRLKTGATINSNSCLDTPQIGPLWLSDVGNQWYFKIQAGSDLGSSEVRLYAVRADAAKPPTDTFKCVGWKIINGQIYAHTADGTTAKDTDTGISMASIWTIKELLILCPSNGVVEFYVDGVLKATHSGAGDYVPDHQNGRFSFNIKNTIAAEKQIAFHTFNWRT